ncbi:hypothetical protein K469DRAFT_196216 [Zopfia rhizophila CBS 207.26]|uniref:Uncharacterized protein n=1 Tax=Zopfia rhizophila CBS 207.26 TaxID=1314779 RepID=A0A6A6EW52_9PEZI|nr:hypothetical protein K469DRAFT_196216 [Zopfia rhizophila CBS 207.26]
MSPSPARIWAPRWRHFRRSSLSATPAMHLSPLGVSHSRYFWLSRAPTGQGWKGVASSFVVEAFAEDVEASFYLFRNIKGGTSGSRWLRARSFLPWTLAPRILVQPTPMSRKMTIRATSRSTSSRTIGQEWGVKVRKKCLRLQVRQNSTWRLQVGLPTR